MLMFKLKNCLSYNTVYLFNIIIIYLAIVFHIHVRCPVRQSPAAEAEVETWGLWQITKRHLSDCTVIRAATGKGVYKNLGTIQVGKHS